MASNNSAAVREFKEKVSHQMEIVKDKMVDVSKDAGKRIDVQARQKPWHFVGFAALFSVFFGFFLGRKSKR